MVAALTAIGWFSGSRAKEVIATIPFKVNHKGIDKNQLIYSGKQGYPSILNE
jgi:hypothetical protein